MTALTAIVLASLMNPNAKEAQSKFDSKIDYNRRYYGTRQKPEDYRYRPNPVTRGYDTFDKTGSRVEQSIPDTNRGFRHYDNHGRYKGRTWSSAPSTRRPYKSYTTPSGNYVRPYRHNYRQFRP